MKSVTKSVLPDGVLRSDMNYPSWKAKNKVVTEVGNFGRLKFHLIKDRGWVIATLPISAARKNFEARTYAIEVEKAPYTDKHNIVTVGNGPHVTATFEIYVTANRLKKLQKYVDIYNIGLGDAGQIRDRISTRRAQTVLRRGGPAGWFR